MDCDIKIYLYNLPWEFELRMKPQHPPVWDRVMRNRPHKDIDSTSKLIVLTKMSKTFHFPQERKKNQRIIKVFIY